MPIRMVDEAIETDRTGQYLFTYITFFLFSLLLKLIAFLHSQNLSPGRWAIGLDWTGLDRPLPKWRRALQH